MPHLVRSLVQMDAPDHPKYRALTQQWFTNQSMRKLEERIRAIARAQVASMIERGGECDFVRDVAVMYPLHVIMEILGVPREDEQRMLMLTQQLFGSQDPELNRSRQVVLDMAEMVQQLQAVVADFSEYFRKLTESRRAQPRDDVATVIANAQIDGRPISDFEAMGYYIIIAAAGHDTTSSSTCGAMWALCEQPGELEKLRANPSLIPGLVEEAFRWTVPVQHFMRTAMEDYTLRGVPIAKGDWLMLCYLSGNRDEEVFEAPFTFRSDRSPNKHISFGTGAHACLGQHLARLEMRILFEELIPKLKSVAADRRAAPLGFDVRGRPEDAADEVRAELSRGTRATPCIHTFTPALIPTSRRSSSRRPARRSRIGSWTSARTRARTCCARSACSAAT